MHCDGIQGGDRSNKPQVYGEKKRKLIHEAIGNKTAVLEKGMVQGQGQNCDIASST